MTVTRWSNKGISPVHTAGRSPKAVKANRKMNRVSGPIKRGLASLFVCAVVLLPLLTIGLQLKSMFISDDPRQASALPVMQVRSLDKEKSADSLKPFDEPLITVTFDDGWETIYSNALPILQKHGIPTTQYVLSGMQNNYQYMSFEQMRVMHQAGHEIACHSVSHRDLTTLRNKDLAMELDECKRVIDKEIGVTVREFAAPYGHNNPATTNAIKQTYRSSRNTAGDIITNAADDHDVNMRANFNRYNIICITLRRDTTVAQLQAAIDYTVKHNGWLVLNYHQVDGGQTKNKPGGKTEGETESASEGTSNFGLDDESLEAQLAAVSRAPARLATIGQVLDALEPEAASEPEPSLQQPRQQSGQHSHQQSPQPQKEY